MFVVNVNYLSGEIVLPTNKTDCHDIAKMLLKVALSTIQCNTKPNQSIIFLSGTTSQQGNLVKKNKDTDFIRNLNIVIKASRSVGIIRGPNNITGTGFRVGDCYIMTALHVVVDSMSMYIHN
jgi:hypothetical protein